MEKKKQVKEFAAARKDAKTRSHAHPQTGTSTQESESQLHRTFTHSSLSVREREREGERERWVGGNQREPHGECEWVSVCVVLRSLSFAFLRGYGTKRKKRHKGRRASKPAHTYTSKNTIQKG